MSVNVCLEKGGYAIFLTLMGGGQHFFSYSEALSATPPPSAEIYEQSLTRLFVWPNQKPAGSTRQKF